ncbi:FtsX-like permease family protein [Flammeovirga yaeyamensis]|uniref:FtsX-like permease family protein n=1 Tax=Flammeovirga yaeyamensis TaxID=367791 RepID=A0AAX1MYG8_9BACT|nr:FtsX-like permease family protein [Flammeovirga yaeyamensis]MBB3696201.1 putative ABC transport system permease protein [Flammeovirga yaeyamensis]NMF34884.1 FtsX-like permease family protein [Flammeovirga yaeyamensis]QWG00289.1 FtsX-like permease family protein [Flammeovirga yaeyamensis]
MRIKFVVNNSIRDLKQSIQKIGPFITSVIVGIASLVALMTFSENVQKDLNRQSKEILGADLEIRANYELKDSILNHFSTEESQFIRQYNFASIAYNEKSSKNRMVDLRALEKGFPYYGQLEVTPKEAIIEWERKDKIVFVDSAVMLQLEASIGDSIQFGQTHFKIAGTIKKGIGQSSIMAATVPIVYFPFKYLSSTGLIQKGSRVNYRYFFQYPDKFDVQNLITEKDQIIENNKLRVATTENNTARIGRFFNDIDSFLKLVAFISLLLGCLGVSSGIYIYIKGKLKSVAILRCLGATTSETFLIYSIQIVILGFIGGVLGAAIGSFAQIYFPILFSDLLMVDVSNDLSIQASLYGILLSIIISVLFGWYPLLQILDVTPVYVLRNLNLLTTSNNLDKKITLTLVIGLFIFGFAYWQLGEVLKAVIFLFSIVFVITLLAIISKSFISILRKVKVGQLPFNLKFGISQLYRPNNQTLILGITIGLGVFLIICMLSIRGILIDKVQNVGKEGDTNLIFYDVQKGQVEPLSELLNKNEVNIEQDAAVVTMSLKSLNSKDKKETLADSTLKVKRWVFDREYRVTFRDHLKENEKTAEGTWIGKSSINEIVPISISKSFLESSGMQFGDQLLFDVQGYKVKTKISHIREVDFARMEANFVVLFPSGVLEAAPAFHVIGANVKDKVRISDIQSKVLKNFPNISTIDLAVIFQSLNDILDRVAFVFKWLGGICILSGFLVLWSSLSISKHQRKNDAGVLRSLGAKSSNLIMISLIEYCLIGLLSSLTGMLLGWIGSFLLAYFVFDIPFFIAISDSILVTSSIVVLTILVGIVYMRQITKVSPLEVLRDSTIQ